jgi:rhodanese-related sulfurtransferase
MFEFLKQGNNFLLAFVFLLSGMMFLWPDIMRLMGKNVKEKSTIEATRLMNDGAVIVDLRSQDEFKSGHLAKAKNIAITDVDKHMGSLPKDKPLLLVCSNGTRSRIAARLFSRGGFTAVFALTGGMAEWTKAQMPIEKSR